MITSQILFISQTVLAVLITTLILLQAQGSGLGATWGGGGETYHTRRGVEKVIFVTTIVAITLFVLISITQILL